MSFQTSEELTDDVIDMRGKFIAETAAAVAHDSTAKALADEVAKGLNTAAVQATNAVRRRNQHAEDDTIPREGRDRMAREAIDNGRSSSKAAIERAGAGLAALEQRLRSQSLPKAPSDRAEDHARAELPMIVSGAQDPLQALLAIVAGDDEALAAAACGRLGKSLLASRGLAADHEIVVAAAVDAASKSSNADRRKAAEALRVVKISGKKALGATSAGVGMRFED